MRSSPWRQRGATLLELAISMAILGILLGLLGTAFSRQADVLGQAGDASTVFVPAVVALGRIADELASTTQNPEGVSAVPVYAVSATEITFRPAVGYMGSGAADHAACSGAGLVSKNGVLYAAYAKRITYDSAARTITLAYVSTPGVPAGVTTATASLLLSGRPSFTSETIARDVASFAFFDGESELSAPPAPTTSSWVIGARIEVARTSVAPSSRGSTITSSVGGAALTTKVRVPPEALINSKSKPVVE
jgi:prepilin-type N-terminal cleavage/methylation domain-containing protein